MTLDNTPISLPPSDGTPAPAPASAPVSQPAPASAAPSAMPAGAPVVPGGTTPGSVLAGILAPALIQIIAIVSVLVIVLVHDGNTDATVVQALLALIIPNSLAGGAVAVTHVIASRPVVAG